MQVAATIGARQADPPLLSTHHAFPGCQPPDALDDLAGDLERLNHELGVFQMHVKHAENINQQSEIIAHELCAVIAEAAPPFANS